ncbi:MAG: cytochrome C oxidase subunit IV family protein [Candidatus Binatia bacterium]
MESNHAIDIDRQVRGYMVVFITLLGLTIVSVGVSYLHLEVHEAITVALIIATFKATLVALFFMHLISEKKVIFIVLAFTALFSLVLLFLPVLTNLDHVSG